MQLDTYQDSHHTVKLPFINLTYYARVADFMADGAMHTLNIVVSPMGSISSVVVANLYQYQSSDSILLFGRVPWCDSKF